MPNPLKVPLPDPLGILQADAEALGAPVVPFDPLAELGRRWFTRMNEARDVAIRNYAAALEGQPLDPRARWRAITNYAEAMRRLPERLGQR